MTEIREFEREHLEGALALFTAAGWETYFEDPERTERVLCSPGSTTLVAVDDGVVAGLVQLQSDGEIQAHLSALLVGEPWRGRGISRQLLREVLQRAGGCEWTSSAPPRASTATWAPNRRPAFD